MVDIAKYGKATSEAGAVGPVIVLVDNKWRDLDVAALIAHHLEGAGVACHLEPLEAFRAVVGAYRPSMVIFNHLNASHLVKWSRRLAEMGVLVGVLPNEGIIYHEESRPFMSGRFHRDAHIDHFFCWNDVHADAVRAEGFEKTASIHTVGVPRFDFYFRPWSASLPSAPARRSGLPRVLLCTNFIFAKMRDRMSEADSLFAGKQQTIPVVRDYPAAVHSHWRSRQRVLEHARALLADGRFELLLRPHPIEDGSYYASWLEGLPSDLRGRIQIDLSSSITSLILDCDLQISCETCTTAIESWIAKKPTIELIFDKHPMLYKETQAAANYPCDDPAKLAELVEQHLAAPDQPEKRELRARHLKTWCNSPDGHSSALVARLIADAIRRKRPSEWDRLNWHDFRRSLKLQGMKAFGQAYHYDPLLPIKGLLFREQAVRRNAVYRKSIKPPDARSARERLKHALAASSND
jgi:surface carbohydrate biosynthesis protein